MRIYYSVTLENETKKSSISYWADSFSVDAHRILRVYSAECGDIAVRIGADERLIVRDVYVQDDYDEELCIIE